jgi:hypothetical protein
MKTQNAETAEKRRMLTQEERETGVISLARVAEISHDAFDELLALAEERERPKEAPKTTYIDQQSLFVMTSNGLQELVFDENTGTYK